MSRYITSICLLILLSLSCVWAQDDEDEPLPPKRAVTKLGGAGGFTPSWLFFDVDPVNQILARENAGSLPKGGLPLWGGQGYAYIMLLQNVRVGGMGASGTVESKSLLGNTTRDVQLSIGFGGVTADYVAPLSQRLDVTLGVLLGGGSMNMKITRDDGTGKAWDNLWNEFGSADSVQNYSRKLTGSFFVIQPSVNIEYAALHWLGFRVGASYFEMAGGSWRMDDAFDIYGVPSNINGKGFMINAGVFVGTFWF